MRIQRVNFSVLTALALITGGGMVLSGCAESTLVAHSAKQIRMSSSQTPQKAVSTQAGMYKIGSAYQIQGKWYTPHEDPLYVEVGTASWYGPNFHGKRTANGEVFDMYAMTAAHRTLPMPSIVRVTNLANGRSVIVRVNDRGPFARDRILDVSKAAAKALDFIKQGTARVKVEILANESLALKRRILNGDTTPVKVAKSELVAAPASYKAEPLAPLEVKRPMPQPVVQTVKTSVAPVVGNARFIQVGAFGNPDNAARLKNRLTTLGPVQIQQVRSASGAILHKVRIGPIMGQNQAHQIMGRVQSMGFVDARLVSPSS